MRAQCYTHTTGNKERSNAVAHWTRPAYHALWSTCDLMVSLYPREPKTSFTVYGSEQNVIALQHPAKHVSIKPRYQPEKFLYLPGSLSAPNYVLGTNDQPSKSIKSFMLLRHFSHILHCRCNLMHFPRCQAMGQQRVKCAYYESGFEGHKQNRKPYCSFFDIHHSK